LSTAFFTHAKKTDSRGLATLRLKLPDNLTRWRVMAAAADGGARFGSGQAPITAQKPLQISPLVPRFLTQGDRAELTINITNQTGRAGRATLSIGVHGAQLTETAPSFVRLPASGQANVPLHVKADKRGTLKLRASVHFGAEHDGVELELPIHAPAIRQTQTLADRAIARDGLEMPLSIPKGTAEGSLSLVVNVAPKAVSALGGGLDSLLEYPHGCVEQTTSRLIPMVLLEDLLRGSDTRLAGSAHRRRIQSAIVHVLKHQNEDGGFGLWPESNSEAFLTAYALWGLLTVRAHDYFVPPKVIERGFGFLNRTGAYQRHDHGQFSEVQAPAFAHFVRTLASRESAAASSDLQAQSMPDSNFALALLGTSAAKRREPADSFIERLLAARQSSPNGGQLIVEGAKYDNWFAYGAKLRATSATTLALLESGRRKEAEPLIDGILGERAADGSWGTTYNNLWALYALQSYAKSEPLAQSTRVRLRIGSQRLADDTLSRERSSFRFVVSDAVLRKAGAAAVLRIEATSGRPLHANVRLRYALKPLAHQPKSQGFTIERELLDAETGKAVKTPRLGQLLRVVLKAKVDAGQKQVALVDRLPAGLEAVDTRFVTNQKASASRSSYSWSWRELHDDRVTFFADWLPAGTHRAEYLVRAVRPGRFVKAPVSAEAMYQPDRYSVGAYESIRVER
jgi:hypothetical protein